MFKELLAIISCSVLVAEAGKLWGEKGFITTPDAKAAVDKVLKKSPIIDGHNDIAMNFRLLTQNRIKGIDLNKDLTHDPFWSHVNSTTTDFVRMRKGGLGGQFWSVFAECTTQMKDAVPQALEVFDLIHRLNRQYKDTLHYATSVADVEEAWKQGKIASLIGVEGGHLIQSNYGILRMYYMLGARYLTLTHSCNTPWADSSPTEAIATDDQHRIPAYGDEGISKWGLGVVDEMNRLGMLVDIAHTSSTVMKTVLNRSKSPPIFSHAGSRGTYNHHRNVPDDVLKLLKKKGGVLMMYVFSEFISNKTNVTIEVVVDHVNHIKKVCGVECLGIGGDYDGVDQTAKGMDDTSMIRNLLEALFITGWSEEELEKIASRNILRVMKKVEEVRDSLKDMDPLEDPHPVFKWYNNPNFADKFFR